MKRSIQRAAVWVLDQYYSDFPVNNPALLNLPKSILSKKMSAFKVYNLGEGKMKPVTRMFRIGLYPNLDYQLRYGIGCP